MAFDVEQLIRDLGVAGEDADEVRKLYGKVPKLGEFAMRQSDYDRKMNDLKTKALEADARVQAEVDSLASWKTERDGVYAKGQQDLLDAQREAFEAKQALEKAAGDAGFDATKYKVEPKREPEKKPEDLSRDLAGRFVDRDQFGQAVVGMARSNAQLLELAEEHRALFGEPLRGSEKLIDYVLAEAKAGRTTTTLRDAWESTFKVPEKREAIRAAKYEADIASAREAGVLQGRSEASLTGRPFTPETVQSPVLKDAAKRNAARSADRPAVSAAVEMFEKIRQKQATDGLI